MRLLKNKILVKMNAAEEKTSGGIFLPVNNRDVNECEVVAVGPAVEHVKVGDTIRKYQGSNGSEIVIDGVRHLFLVEDSDVDVIL